MIDDLLPAPRVHLRLLGPFAAAVGATDTTAALSHPKRLALVTWLAVARPYGLHRRDTLCALFWPESSGDNARAALRQLLQVLRRELGEVLITEGDLVGLDSAVLSCDVRDVLAAFDAGDDAQAVDLYAGELLPGLHVPEAQGFERWLEEQRGQLHRMAAQAARRLVDRVEAAGEGGEALHRAERAVAIDPENEAGLRRLLALQARTGDRALALRTFEQFERRLKADWGTGPEPSTLALVEQIRSGGLPFTVAAGHPSVSGKNASPVAQAGASSPLAQTVPAVTRPRPRLWPWIAGAVLAGGAVLIASRPPRVDTKLVANRVLVTPFANRTGDSTVDAVGLLAADWVIQALQRSGIAEVVDPATAFLTTRGAIDRDPPTIAGTRDLARGTRAGLVLVGSITTVGDSAEYSARLVDSRNARILTVLDPIRAPLTNVTAALDELRSRVAGAIASQTNTVVVPLSAGSRPPRLEAYQEFVAGLDLFNSGNGPAARHRFQKAIALDSSFTLAMIWLYYRYKADLQVDSAAMVARLIASGPDRGTGVMKAWLEVDSLERADAPFEVRLRALKEVRDLSPGSPDEWRIVHLLINEAGRPREALEILKAVDQERSWFPQWGRYGVYLSEALHMVGDFRGELEATEVSRRRYGNTAGMDMRAMAALGYVDRIVAKLDTILVIEERPPWVIWWASPEMAAHGHVREAVQLLEWGEPVQRKRLERDTSLELRVDHAIVQAQLAFHRGDRRLAVEARQTLERALDLPLTPSTSLIRENAMFFGYWPAVCVEGDSARIAHIPSEYPQVPHHDVLLAICKGDNEGAIRALARKPPDQFLHAHPLFQRIASDPRVREWLRPKG